jgi:hypothetical protein
VLRSTLSTNTVRKILVKINKANGPVVKKLVQTNDSSRRRSTAEKAQRETVMTPTNRFARGFTNSTKTEPQKKTLADYQYVVSDSKNSGDDFNETTRYLLSHIGTTFTHGDVIQQALEDRKDFDFDSIIPIKKISTAIDPDKKKLEDESFDAIFKAKILQHAKKEDIYDSNMGKAYGLLWKQCNREMQNKIEGRSDYESKIRKNAINLLNAIEEHSLNYEETRYDMSIVADAIRTLFTIR